MIMLDNWVIKPEYQNNRIYSQMNWGYLGLLLNGYITSLTILMGWMAIASHQYIYYTGKVVLTSSKQNIIMPLPEGCQEF